MKYQKALSNVSTIMLALPRENNRKLKETERE